MNQLRTDIILNYNEWKYIENKCISKTGSWIFKRSKLNTKFDHLISQKLQEKEKINCALISKHNYLKKNNERLTKTNYWHGKYRCRNKNCSNLFYLSITNEPITNSDVTINVQYSKIDDHQKHSYIRCTGESREDMAKNLLAFGTKNIRIDNMLHNKNEYLIEGLNKF